MRQSLLQYWVILVIVKQRCNDFCCAKSHLLIYGDEGVGILAGSQFAFIVLDLFYSLAKSFVSDKHFPTLNN